MYLRPLPFHNRNVVLALNCDTGRRIPQFHVKFDVNFHTVFQEKHNSKWQMREGFVQEPSTDTTIQREMLQPKKIKRSSKQTLIPVYRLEGDYHVTSNNVNMSPTGNAHKS